ncbi:MAG: Hsp70 family protein [Mycobacterium sp.]|nr:Hsp70 family protein [Mycobacterium sp.]
MSDSLGLSIGVANLGAARVGSAPVTRRSVLTLVDQRAPEVGVPDENPNLTESGVVLRGFIERIGDSSPIVAADGSTHRCDELTVEALDAMARTLGYGAPVAIAVPDRWREDIITALRDALQAKPALAPNGMPPALISSATAALAALYAKPGFPTDGVVALCDFGASGTSVTLTDAAANFRQIGETIHYTDFSGDRIDQAILRHLYANGMHSDNDDATGTVPLGSLTQRLDECRRAKEQLSAATVTIVPAEMPGSGNDVRLSRTELEGLISEPLDRFVAAVEQMLQRANIPASGLAAIATVGGGACIPLVTERLSDRLHVPIVTTATPMLSAAIGAAVLAQQRSSAAAGMGAGGNAATAIGPAASAPTVMEPAAMARAHADTGAQPGFDAAAPTDIAPSAWAGYAAAAAPGESSADDAQSGTYRALAWSQEAATGNEPLPYTGEDYSSDYPPPPPPAPTAVKTQRANVDRYVVAYQRPPWYRRSPVLFGVAAAAAAAALLGVAVLAFKLNSANTKPTHTTSKVTTPSRPPASQPPPPPSPAPPPPATVTETSTTEATIAPPPPSTVTMTPPTTTTTVQPTTTRPTTSWPTTTTYPSAPVTSTPPTTTRPVIPLYPAPVAPGYGQ